jgi:hypothetical protein
MARPFFIVSALSLMACTTSRTFDMQWELTTQDACKGAGIDPRYASEQEVTLRYAKTPNYFSIICSNKLAAALREGGKPVVPMVVRRNGGPGSSTSICEIAGLKDDAPGSTCTFQGQVRGGFEGSGKPTPWD